MARTILVILNAFLIAYLTSRAGMSSVETLAAFVANALLLSVYGVVRIEEFKKLKVRK